jgi:mgtE-like transporter
LIAAALVGSPTVATVVGLVGVAVGVAAIVAGTWSGSELVKRVVRESAPVLILAVAIDTAAGVVMETRLETLLEEPALLVLIPPFVASCGALGGMLASRLASKLHMGLLTPRPLPTTEGWLDLSLTVVLATATFTGVGGIGWVAAEVGGVSGPSVLGLLATSLGGGVLATIALTTVAYVAATATHRFGLDPDNHGIPIVTASMDLLGILCLVAAIGLTGGLL